jgi:hypothetical protein
LAFSVAAISAKISEKAKRFRGKEAKERFEKAV